MIDRYCRLPPFKGTALLNLFRNGVDEKDIIGTNQLIQDYANHALQWRPNHEEKDGPSQRQ